MATKVIPLIEDSIAAVPYSFEKYTVKTFKQQLKIEIKSHETDPNGIEDKLVFDMKGVDYSFANALRRIMLSEVETVAVEKVNMFQNTSVMDDETLCHRLGLIPLKIDAQLLEEKGDNPFNETNAVIFKLHVKCESGRKEVYSSDLIWQPTGDQKNTLIDVKPLFDDILIVKLAEGQVVR